MNDLINLDDYARAARERMTPGVRAWMEGGALDEITLCENEAAWLRYQVRPRVMRDVSAIDLATTLLGTPSVMPVGVAPTAQHGMFCPEAELATARAADSGVPFVASTMSSLTLEEIAKADGNMWFQLYIRQAPSQPRALVQRAEAAGYQAIVLTVDVPVLGQRERDRRLGEEFPSFVHANLPDEPDFDATLTWESLDRLRRMTSLPLVVKGVMTGEDAALAVEHGAAAVWASNHGGRQLDRVPAGIDVLEEIVRAVAGRAEVYVDGAVRRGIDVAIALALGANAAFVGRPMLHGLAVNGEAGARDVLRIIEAELANAMALLGAATVRDVVRQMVVRPT